MSTRRIEYKHEIKYSIEEYIDMNMPKISSHGGSFAIYEINLTDKFVRIKFAGSCASCPEGNYKFEQLMKRIPEKFNTIDNVYIELV